MITPEEIKRKAQRKYASFLQSLIENKPFEKMVIRGDKSYTQSSLPQFEKEIREISSHSKSQKGFGYTLDFQRVKTKYLGTQDLPVLIYFDTEKDFLKFLNKEAEVELFKKNVDKIIAAFPELKDWVVRNPLKVIVNEMEWDGILKVCRYFTENPKPDLYIRELPIQVHTKFVEQNQSIIRELLDVLIPNHTNPEEKHFEKRFYLKYAEPQIRFKVLDEEISKKFFSGLNDIAIPVGDFERMHLPVKRVIVLENKTTFYAALTLPEMNESIALFGSGFSVSNLKNVAWFNDAELLYWGDIDVQGFEILSQFRNYFPHAESVLMDKPTFDAFFEEDAGTPSNISASLNLTVEEQALYEILKSNNWRLEQEKIPVSYVNRALKNIGTQ